MDNNSQNIANAMEDFRNHYPEVFFDDDPETPDYAIRITFADVLADESLLGAYALQISNDYWRNVPWYEMTINTVNVNLVGYKYFRRKEMLLEAGQMPDKDSLVRYREDKLNMIAATVPDNLLQFPRKAHIGHGMDRGIVDINEETVRDLTAYLFETEKAGEPARQAQREKEKKHEEWLKEKKRKEKLAKSRDKLIVDLCAIMDKKIAASDLNNAYEDKPEKLTVAKAKKRVMEWLARPKALHPDYGKWQLSLTEMLKDKHLMDSFLYLHANDYLRPLLAQVKTCFPIAPLMDKEKRKKFMESKR